MSSAQGPSTPSTTHPAHTLLARAHSPTTATEIFTAKIKNKPLLLKTSQETSQLDKRALRRHIRLRKKEYYLRKQKPRPLSAKEKRSFGVHDLSKEEIKYHIYQGLWKIWVGYMWEVLNVTEHGVVKWNDQRTVTPQGHGILLATADFHGAKVEIVRSKCVERVGLKGIVVRDTKFAFVIVTEKDEAKTLPKKDTVFRYEVPLPDAEGQVPEDGDDGSQKLVFELHGNQFEMRPADRAKKGKFKWKPVDYL